MNARRRPAKPAFVGLEDVIRFTDRFEGAFGLSFQQVTYEADPVVLELPEDTSDSAAVGQVLTGRNIPLIHSMSLGVVYALDDLTVE